jgi:hypothetical protein
MGPLPQRAPKGVLSPQEIASFSRRRFGCARAPQEEGAASADEPEKCQERAYTVAARAEVAF